MTPLGVMIGTVAFGACIFAVAMLANRRLRGLRVAEGTTRHALIPEGEVTVIKGGVMAHFRRFPSLDELSELSKRTSEKK